MEKLKTRENTLEEPRDRAEALLRLILACLVIGFAVVIALIIVK